MSYGSHHCGWQKMELLEEAGGRGLPAQDSDVGCRAYVPSYRGSKCSSGTIQHWILYNVPDCTATFPNCLAIKKFYEFLCTIH